MTETKPLNILQLYPRDMNIYGDWGNTLALLRRAQWHGYDPVIIDYNPGDELPTDIDIVVGGGGQDSGQEIIHSDLIGRQTDFKQLADDDIPMLLVCGLYQLFGHFFKTREGKLITGIGILDIETHGSEQRLIGNIVTQHEKFGQIVGYENHSGLTYLGETGTAFGKLIKGAGNNGQDSTEGAIYRNVIGTYMHGSLLPKNPELADWLIEQAAIRRYGDFQPQIIDDRFAQKARAIAFKRPR